MTNKAGMKRQREAESMKQILYHGMVFTRDAENPVIPNGAVVWEDDRILEVGPADALLAAHADAERIDAKGGIILPAFINAHHHI